VVELGFERGGVVALLGRALGEVGGGVEVLPDGREPEEREQTMSTSERRSADAGVNGPCEACTDDMESSTVIRCSATERAASRLTNSLLLILQIM